MLKGNNQCSLFSEIVISLILDLVFTYLLIIIIVVVVVPAAYLPQTIYIQSLLFIVRFIFRWWARCCPLQHWSRLHKLQCYSATFAADDAEFVKICEDILLDKLCGYTFFKWP